MSKDDFLVEAMKLLKQYIEEDEGIAFDLLKAQGVEEDDIPSVIYTVSSISYGRV